MAAAAPLAGPISALDHASREALVSDLCERLVEHIDDEGVVFPMQTYLIDAVRP